MLCLYELLFLVRLILQSNCCDTAISLKQINIFPVDFSSPARLQPICPQFGERSSRKVTFGEVVKLFIFGKTFVKTFGEAVKLFILVKLLYKLLWNFWWSCKTFYGRVDHLSPLSGCPPIYDDCADKGRFVHYWPITVMMRVAELFWVASTIGDNWLSWSKFLVFFHWYPPKKLKYGKPRLGESTLT